MLDVDAISDDEFSLVLKARRATVVAVGYVDEAISLAAKGWGIIRQSDNFGTLFRLTGDGSEALDEYLHSGCD